MEKRATVREVAAATGMSIATVSRVLNGQANVATHTRDRVLQALRELGSNAPQPRATHPSPGSVYVRCPYLLTDYFGLVVTSIAETLALHDLEVVLDSGVSSQSAPALSRLAGRPGTSGAILVLPPEPAEALDVLRAAEVPLVVVDPRVELPRDVVSVSAAHFAGARKLMAHVVGLGHRRVGVLGGPREWLASDGRLAGYAAALADVGVLGAPELVRHVPEPTEEWGRRAAGELLDLGERPTALVAFNDKMAVGALKAARERGLDVPGDVSVAGFDDLDLSRATTPGLTTVRQPLQEMGRMAVTLLVRLLRRHELEATHVELATDLMVRGSTGPARG
ncbi:LacI family DNA-binding transcriptional regulator [Actinokineospora bangkokensis]|uniref:LacI family transcriptional regulator n=1 Tax=Actinokineospora bangkokensis TaxID=1193682 RepID=A0A1Q9LJL4_9PSEU|nr:LacI family DNA-binding transcriptional regulator [Actinokineospora bangkokensis]OLR92218.1 LacI family transcriptional regulator [Actinokineospora bangkokensis]